MSESSPQRPGIKRDDTVLVFETESPWADGKWRGRVSVIYEGGDLRVVPLDPMHYRPGLTPCEEYVSQGLYLTSRDAVEKVS